MRKTIILSLAVVVILLLLFAALFSGVISPAFQPLGVTFIGYTNGTAVVFRVTNPTSHVLLLHPWCPLINDQGRPLGIVPVVGYPLGKQLRPHTAELVAVARPATSGSWRVQFMGDYTGWQRRWNEWKLKAEKAGWPMQKRGGLTVGGPSERIEP